MNKLSFDHWWYTAERFLELACASHILPLLLCTSIFESLKYAMKSLETLYSWSIQFLLLKKLNLDYSAQILLLLQSVLYFTYIASRAFSVVSLLIWKVIILNQNNLKLQKSPNHWLSMKKLIFDHWSYTAKRFWELTCGSHILPLLLSSWIFESLKYAMKSLETLYSWSIQSSLLKKLNLDYSAQILLLLQSVLYFSYIA